MSREDDFRAARAATLAELRRTEAATAERVRRLIAATQEEIARRLASPSQFDAWRLPLVRRELGAILGRLSTNLSAEGGAAIDAGGRLGLQLIDQPLAAAELRLDSLIGRPDERQLLAIRAFTTGRLRDVTREAVQRVDLRLGLVLAGVDSPSQAIDGIAQALDSGRGRALTITRTELGRAFSVAGHERQQQAVAVLPGLRKQWRRSGKRHPRLTHELADGQIREVNQPFLVGGIEILFPRDPKAPPGETINCGCVSLPHMAHWEVSRPGRQPYTAEELDTNRAARQVQEILLQRPDPDPEPAAVLRSEERRIPRDPVVTPAVTKPPPTAIDDLARDLLLRRTLVTGREALLVMDERAGRPLGDMIDGAIDEVDLPASVVRQARSVRQRLAVHHSHPGDDSPGLADIDVLNLAPGIWTVASHGPVSTFVLRRGERYDNDVLDGFSWAATRPLLDALEPEVESGLITKADADMALGWLRLRFLADLGLIEVAARGHNVELAVLAELERRRPGWYRRTSAAIKESLRNAL